MPIYEYHCPACETDFERLVRSAEERDQPACPQCGARRSERKFSVFAAQSADTRGGSSLPLPRSGGCGRCGDPQGPCGLE